ncbi:MAG: hypothetical protein AB7I38_06295 [Dehalococcoidia bacterium]
MRRTIESRQRYYAMGQRSVYGLLTFARRVVTLVSWLSVVMLAGAVFAYVRLIPDLTSFGVAFVGLLLFVPPLALLHFALVLRLLRLRFDPFGSGAWLRLLTFSRLVGSGLLLSPSYWASVVVLGFASIIVVPFAVVLSLV